MTERGYLGEVLEELRLERGMSLRALAAQAGLSVGYLSELESGKQKNPSLEALRGLASALGVSITVSRDEPGYIRVSEGSPPCVNWVRSGVPTVREEIEEAKEEAADWRTTDDASLWPTRASVDDITALRGRLGPTPWHQMYQGVPPERDQQEDWDAMKAEMDKDPEQRAMWNAAWRSAPLYGWWKALLAEMETYKPVAITNEPGAEVIHVSEVGKWPADYKAPSGGMAEGAVAIGVDLAHGPGKAVTTVWRVRDGKMEMLPPWLTWKPETWRLAIVGDAGTWVELETTSDVVGYAAPGGNAADWTALLMMLRAGTPGRASMRLAWHAELGIFCFRNHREGLATPFQFRREEAPAVAAWLEEKLAELRIGVAVPVLDEPEAT